MVKITIKHYLNKKLKPHLVMGVLKHSVYVRVTFARENSRFISQWVNYPISENEFENNKRVQGLIEYETKIINGILTNDKTPENLNLVSRLRYSTVPLSDCFLEWTLNEKKVKKQIIEYIINKTELNERIITPYVRLDYIDAKGWIELSEKNIFVEDSKEKTIFFALLLEFESIHYPNNKNEYEVNGILNFYEWIQNKGKERFIEYVKESKLLTEKQIVKNIQHFDNDIFEWSSANM